MPEGSAPRPAILVSACLLGVRCNHVGRSNVSPAVVRLGIDHDLVPICPEVAGGLPVPRPAAELQPDGTVRTAAGEDVTECYGRGAAVAVDAARSGRVGQAVLKARSPSCGCSEVYDGTFSRTLVSGEGITARALREAGVLVRSDEEVECPPTTRRPGSANMGGGALSSDG